MKEEYHGYTIEWHDSNRSFWIECDHNEVKRNLQTVEECHNWIDKKLKEKYKRVPVLVDFYREHNGTILSMANATSMIDATHVWVSSEKYREKKRFGEVYLQHGSNLNRLTQLEKIKKTINNLQKEYDDLFASLEPLTPEMMEIDEGGR